MGALESQVSEKSGFACGVVLYIMYLCNIALECIINVSYIYMSRYYDCIHTSRIYIFFGYLDFGFLNLRVGGFWLVKNDT